MLKNILNDKKILLPDDCHTELRAQVTNSYRVSLNNGLIVGNASEEFSGVSCRVMRNGVCGFASEADMSDEAVKSVIDSARSNMLFMDSHAGKGQKSVKAAGAGSFFTKESYNGILQSVYLGVAKLFDDYIVKNCKNITGRRVIAMADVMEKALVTNDAYDAHTLLPRGYIYVFLEAESNETGPISLFEALGGYGSFDNIFEHPERFFGNVDALYEKLMQKREGVYADAGVKTCILSGGLSGMLAHEAVGHTVEADLVIGGSVAKNKLGCPVASPIVNLTDFANTAYGMPTPLPVFVDDEGTPCTDAKIIENGILTGYMNNIESAARFDMIPCGNARAYAYSDEPLIRMRNTAILAGDSTLEDMISSVEDGYYLTNTNNGQADTSGEFMFGVCMGYEIKKGKLGRAIFDTTISGVAFEMLKTVDMLGNEATMEWESSGYCGKKQRMPVGLGGPAMKCKVTMGGR